MTLQYLNALVCLLVVLESVRDIWTRDVLEEQ